MLSSNSVPISPPVTPKSFARESSILSEDDSSLQLPPPIALNNIDLRRKSNARRYSRAMATADKDAITFRDPFAVEGNAYLNTITSNNRSKSTPQRSPSPSTRGSFTMDIYEDLCGVNTITSESRKRRNNGNMEERMTIEHVTQTQPAFSTASILNTERHVKKAKTDAAAAYDNVDINLPDSEIFQDPEWIPDMDVFEALPNVRVVWKGTPLAIDHLPYYELLHPGEVNIASTLRLTPEQYLKCKRSLILAAQEFDKVHIAFRKSDAQKCVRIDVNKTSTLWSVFSRLGWFNPRSSNSNTTHTDTTNTNTSS